MISIRNFLEKKYYRILGIYYGYNDTVGILENERKKLKTYDLHGELLVCSPKNAISTFERSGLKHLALGNYLISKNE